MRSNIEELQSTGTGAQNGSTHANGAAALTPTRTAQRERRPIIAHCHLRWDFVWQRPQQIFSRLADYHPILIVEEPIIENGEAHLRVSSPHANIVRAIPVLPPTVAAVDPQCEATLAMLRHALVQHPLLAKKFCSPVQWFYSPMPAPCFVGQFGAAGVVYDCMDELANFRFAPPDLAQRESFLLSKADVVFTGGHRLFQAKSQHHRNVHFFGCGVDAAHYSRARLDATEVPPDVANLPHPVFGYFGVLDERIDYDLLAQLAKNFPRASLVMIGPLAKVEPSVLPRLNNIHWLGQRAYDDLPAYLKAFDVCLMPFALNEATQYINPTKTLEYMAAGKPVVSTAVPDVMSNFTPVVDIAMSARDFIGAVKRAWEHPDPDRIKEGIERAEGASWQSVVSAMRRHMLQAIPNSDQPATESRPGDFP